MNQAQTISTGEIKGSPLPIQLPDIPCSYVILKGLSANTGNVYIGTVDVLGLQGSTNTRSGFELDSGDQIELPIDNLNKLYLISDHANDNLTYIAFR
jgi:hypothetical protein